MSLVGGLLGFLRGPLFSLEEGWERHVEVEGSLIFEILGWAYIETLVNFSED